MDELTFSSHLRSLRRERGLTARELSRRIKRSPAFISQIETGRSATARLPALEILRDIAAALGVALGQLVPPELLEDMPPSISPAGGWGGDAEYQGNPPAAGPSARRLLLTNRRPGERQPGSPLKAGFRSRLVPILNSLDVVLPGGGFEALLRVQHGYFAFPPQRPAAYCMPDESLAAEDIHEGDYLLVDLDETSPADGDLALVRYAGTTFARVWHQDKGRLTLDPASSAWESLTLDEDESQRLTLVGLFCGLFPSPYNSSRSRPTSRTETAGEVSAIPEAR